MCETGVEALQAKLKLADQETEDAKEALRIERAKMTREKKQWALQSKSEEKRWADDMAQLSREKRMWAEEKDRLTSPRVLQDARVTKKIRNAHSGVHVDTRLDVYRARNPDGTKRGGVWRSSTGKKSKSSWHV